MTLTLWKMSCIGIDPPVKVLERLHHWPIPGEFSQEIMENLKKKVEGEIKFTFDQYPPYCHDLIGYLREFQDVFQVSNANLRWR